MLYFFHLTIITEMPNKAQKKMFSILSWENSKKAALEAELRMIEVNDFFYCQKYISCIGMIHEEAEEKRALVEVEAKRGEDLLKAEERNCCEISVYRAYS
ncbi:unnamed protein product [Musa acuminata subsp. burmannicoides]